MHSNIDCAIAYVIERGQQLNVPNVFSAYLQTLISPTSYDDDRFETDDAIARAALVTFERAMDKYPMPVLLPAPTKTKKSKGKPSTAPTPTTMPGTDGAKKYPIGVAQLRWQYQRATAADGEYQGCTCASCGGRRVGGRSGLIGGTGCYDPAPLAARERDPDGALYEGE